MDSSVQIPNEVDPREIAIKLIKAMETNADSKEALKKVYQVLSKDETASLPANVLPQVLPSLGMNLTDVEVNVIIHQVKPNINNDGEINCVEFLEIMKNIWTKKANELIKAMENDADTKEALRQSYQVLSKDPNATVSVAVLRQVMPNLVKLTDGEVDEIINHVKTNVKNDGQINCDEFVNIMQNIWTKKANELIKAMENDADTKEALRKSYQVLSKDSNATVSVAVLRQVMPNLVKLTDGEVDEIINHVKSNIKNDGQINCDEFVNIMQNTWTKIANKLIKAMEEDAVSHEALKKAYLVLGRDENVYLSVAVLRQVMPNLDVKRTDVEVDMIINLVKPNISSDGQINCEEFVNIMKKTELANKLIKTMEEDADSHKVLQNAYLVLSGGENAPLSVDVLHQVMAILGINPIRMEIAAVIQQVKPNINNDRDINCVEFVEIMKNIWTNIANKLIQAMEEEDADSHKALKKAYLVLSRDENASFPAAVLCQVMPIFGMKITDVEVNEIINRVKANIKNDRHINLGEFTNIMKNIWTMIANQLIKAMEEDADSNKALEKSYQVLRKDPNASLSVAALQQVMANLGVKLTNEEVNEIINRVKPNIKNDRQINREEFVNIMKKIWAEIANKLIKEMEGHVDSHEALRKAYQVFSGDQNASFSAAVLCQVMPYLGLKLTDEDVNEIINQVKTNIKNDRQINCEEFVNIMKKIWTKLANELIKTMEEDGNSDMVLKKAYSVLTRDENASLSAAVLRQVMPNLGVKLTDKEVDVIIRQFYPDIPINFDIFVEIMKKIWIKTCNELTKSEDTNAYVPAVLLRKVMPNLGAMKLTDVEVDEIINQVNPKIENGRINYAEIIKIINFIKEPTEENQINKIYGVLNRDQTKKIVLYGKPGAGKTWMARRIAERAKRNKKIDIAIWIYLNSGLNLVQSIASQLLPHPVSGKVEAKEDMKETSDKQTKNDEKLLKMIDEQVKGKKFLLILDGEKDTVKEDDEMSKVEQLPIDGLEYKLLFLIPKICCEPSSMAIGIMVMPLTHAESMSLLKNMVKKDILPKIKEFTEFFIDKSQRLRGEVLIISRIVNYFGQTDSGLKKLQSVKDELLKEDGTTLNDSDYSNVIRLLISQNELLPTSVLIDCYSCETPKKHFLHQPGMVHYSELISYWILEGHLGHFDSIEEAYRKGHNVLMELLHYDILKHVENGYVISKRTKFNVDIHDFCKFFQNIRLGLATAFDNKLGSVVVGDGIMKTFSSNQEREGISTLLIDGNRIGESPANLFKAMSELGSLKLADEHSPSTSGQERKEILIKSLEELEILAIFNPTCKPFPLPLNEMPKLRLLVLRGCKFLESLDEILNYRLQDNLNKSQQKRLEKCPSAPLPSINPDPIHSANLKKKAPLNHFPSHADLKKLTVLEISGPSPLKEIPDDLFKMMTSLKSLNLSLLQIVKLPASLYSLLKVEFLILRGCSCLEKLGTLKNFGDLQVLDLSSATSFKTFQDKSFSGNTKLQILNLSQTKITKLPLVRHLKELKYLSLSKCTDLCRVRKIGKLEKLQILDISDAKRVDKFLDPSLLELKSLIVLNVSGTAIRRLPSFIFSPRYLYSRDCSELEQLPPTLENVQVLDLSGSVHLKDIKEEFIKKLKCLRELNLSKTKVVSIPSLSSLGKLQRLLLSQCLYLKSLEGLSSLKELELLDLSGCKALLVLEDKSFDEMNCLRSLNLSETHLSKLPSLSNLKNLKELYLRNCPKLNPLLDLQPLEVLEVFDYSRTPLKPSFADHAPPRHIIGPSSSSSDDFDSQKCLKDLELTIFQQETLVGGDEKEKLPQKEMNQYYWSISRLRPSTHVNQKTIGVPVKGVHFLHLLKMIPSLLEKIKQFHFFVYPEEAHTQFADETFNISELELREIYFQQVSQHPLETHKRCLEIRGFLDFPQCLGQLLKHAEFVVLIENSFISFLSDLGADNIKEMKVCWIERCNNMDHVIFAEEAKETEKPAESVKGQDEQEENFAANLEILWVSDVTKLSRISNHNSQRISFENLKSLYLEYCPKLSVICPSSQQLPKLEILHVKYCQKLKTLFGDEAELPCLHSLHLWGLPELKKISCTGPSLRILRVGDCHLLENIFDASTCPGSLETLQVKFCDQLKTIIKDGTVVLGSLKSLNLLNLPVLMSIGAALPLLKETDSKILGCLKPPELYFREGKEETSIDS